MWHSGSDVPLMSHETKGLAAQLVPLNTQEVDVCSWKDWVSVFTWCKGCFFVHFVISSGGNPQRAFAFETHQKLIDHRDGDRHHPGTHLRVQRESRLQLQTAAEQCIQWEYVCWTHVIGGGEGGEKAGGG
jgi:hypothetical protein